MKITKIKVLGNNSYDMSELEKGQLHQGWEVVSVTPIVVGDTIKLVVVYLEEA